MCSYLFTLLFPQDTRVTDKSETSIENSHEFTTVSGKIAHSVFAQLMQLFIFDNFATPKSPPKSDQKKMLKRRTDSI